MRFAPPAPPELGAHDGLAYALFLPERPASAGVVILHGAGSAKEAHFDFARTARAAGIAALAFDARGHGASAGSFGAGAVDDALTMASLLRRHAPRVAVRGSSLGGALAIHAGAAAGGELAAVVAICPAPSDLLLRGLRSGSMAGIRADLESLAPWLEAADLSAAAAALAPRTALLLMHAHGDEQVPWTVSEELFAAAGEPKRLIVVPGGHHRSVQHDPELQRESLRFVERSAPGGRERA